MTEQTSATIPFGSPPSSREEYMEFKRLDEAVQEARFASWTPDERRTFLADWKLHGRLDQLTPEGDWTTWLMLGGRGAGKTRAGAEWVRALVLGRKVARGGAVERIALIGETMADVRDVMVKGESGLMSLDWGRGENPRWVGSGRRLELPNGAIAFAFSSEDPESLRGPQFSAA
jgi:phage terminase large subunit-like protein